MQRGVDPEAFIRAGTYPEFAEAAINFFDRLYKNRDAFDEPIDFGRTALDVGSQYGQYLSAIRALGLERVIAVEVPGRGAQSSVREGWIDRNDVFMGTLEDRAKQDHEPVDTAFVLNMYPRVLRDRGFLGALVTSVRPGGLVVTSFAREIDGDELGVVVEANPDLPLRLLKPNSDRLQHVPMHSAGPAHTAICLWRREHGILDI